MRLKQRADCGLFFSSCADLFRASTGSRPASGWMEAWMAVTSTAMTLSNKESA
jgi:hypothetical protein